MGSETVGTLVVTAIIVLVLAAYVFLIGLGLQRLSFTLGTIIVGLRAIRAQTDPVGGVLTGVLGDVTGIDNALAGVVDAVGEAMGPGGGAAAGAAAAAPAAHAARSTRPARPSLQPAASSRPARAERPAAVAVVEDELDHEIDDGLEDEPTGTSRPSMSPMAAATLHIRRQRAGGRLAVDYAREQMGTRSF